MTAADEKEDVGASAPAVAKQSDRDGDLETGGAAAPSSSPAVAADDTISKKRKERLEQNRISARESRKRKKTMIEELQRTVITLSRENKDLNDRNDDLRCKLMAIGAKVRGSDRNHSAQF